jgi:hypothetical protein
MSRSQAQDGWLEESRKEHRRSFSELDVLLRALERFFFIENQPFARESHVNKNFHSELNAVKDVVSRVLSILEITIPESNRNAYWFQKFAENKLLNDRKRDLSRAGMYTQDSPEKSIYVLYDSFISLKSLLGDLLRSTHVTYMSFNNIGQIFSRELRENVFFNPFRHDINPEVDFIENKEIKDVVNGIEDRETRKITSIIFLHLFRLLRYISHMDHKSMNSMSISASLLNFSLLKSEIDVFHSYVEKTTEKLHDEGLVMLLRALSYQFAMESKRVFHQEMKEIFNRESPTQFRVKIENSRGILKNLTEQSVIQLARHWNQNIKGERIFDFFVTKKAQSVKLREDIYVLNRMVQEIHQRTPNMEDPDPVLKVLLSYMDYFEDFSFKLIRYDDFEEFSRLFFKIRNDHQRKAGLEKILENCHRFGVFLDTTLRQIQNRAELKGVKVDIEKMEDFVRQYLPSS